jgi:hypothetical protein
MNAAHGVGSDVFDCWLALFSTDSDPDSAMVIWHAQSRAVARDSDLVASVTNGTLQLPLCGAAGDAF